MSQYMDFFAIIGFGTVLTCLGVAIYWILFCLYKRLKYVYILRHLRLGSVYRLEPKGNPNNPWESPTPSCYFLQDIRKNCDGVWYVKLVSTYDKHTTKIIPFTILVRDYKSISK